jgi:excisionase family DNA binding protein
MMPVDRSEAIRAAVDALVAAIVAAATPEPADAPDRLYGIPEAAALLSCGRSLLYTEMRAGRLRALHVGRRVLIPASAIRDYIRAGAPAPGVGPVSPASGTGRPSDAPPSRRPVRRPKAAA